MTEVAGPQDLFETCPYCDPVGLFGLAPADDPRYLGGHVDESGVRHDPCAHESDCPTLRT